MQYKHQFGGLLTLRLGSKEACFQFIKALKLVKNLANLGDTKSLIIHPDSTIYRDLTREEKDNAGAYHDLLRVSVGIEHADDIIQDFEKALSTIKEAI
jgi:O-acetylhomoserine (thiol)-lyase